MMRVYCSRHMLLGLILAFLSTCAVASESSSPNILLILADDMGINDIGSWGDGVAPTPTLDQLSKKSIRFRRHYADSSCSVSRAALLTGRAPVNIGFEPDGLGLSPDLATLPRSLQALGYRTVHIGKWHVGEGIEYPGTWPLRQGFDHWFGMYSHFVLRGPDARGNWTRQAPTYNDPWLQEDAHPAKHYKGNLDDLLTARAVRVIEHSSGNQPWFLNLWLLAPHHPFEPSEAFRQQYADTEQGRYMALLNQLDSNVGRVLRALERSGQADNTIVVFASDNGSPNFARDSNWPLQGTKATYHEGGVRVPMLIRLPGHAGGDITAVTQVTDLYPTLLAMVGGSVPADLDGTDLTPFIQGRRFLADRALYRAADVKNWGMSYAGYLPGVGGFYRNFLSAMESVPINSALGDGRKLTWNRAFSREQASLLVRQWEAQARPIPVQWHPAKDGKLAYLSGRNYQRSPAFGSFSMGLGIKPGDISSEPQTLVEQKGLWKLELDEHGRLSFRYGTGTVPGVVPRWKSGCNSLVISLNIRPASAHPFEAQAESVLTLYLNGEVVISSQQLMQRPESEESFTQPTFLGGDADGERRFAGHIGRPVLVGKYLQPEQEGYRLSDMDAAVCPVAESVN